jgi:hypothetical protein
LKAKTKKSEEIRFYLSFLSLPSGFRPEIPSYQRVKLWLRAAAAFGMAAA